MRQLRKKAQMKVLVTILIVLVGGFLIFSVVRMFFSKAEGPMAEAICRGSLALRSRSSVQVGFWDIGLPYYCKTIEKKIPEVGDSSAEGVKREIANMAARCWWMMGQGLLDEIFGGMRGAFKSDEAKCFMCYTFVITNIKDRSGANPVTGEELKGFMEKEYYLKQYQFMEICDNGKDDDGDGKIDGDDSDCQEEQKDVEELTYLYYIQHLGGRGVIETEYDENGDDLKFLEKKQVYAVTYISNVNVDHWQSSFKRIILDRSEIAGIYISKVETVENRCNLILDVSGK